MAVKRGLGKGLDSLIAPKVPVQPEQGTADFQRGNYDGEIVYLSIQDIEPNRLQPRKHFDEDTLQELAESIRQHGVIQPLLVRKQGNYYEIIAGERRWRAAKLAHLKKVPVLVKDVTDQECSEIALIENLQREDLNPLEEANAYQQLIEEYGLKQDEIAGRVSKSRSAVANSLRLLKLDERVQEMLQRQQISAGHARSLLAIPQKDRQYELAQKISREGLSVRDTEKLIQEQKQGPTHRKQKEDQREKSNVQQEAVYKKVSEKLQEHLGTKVEILDRGGKGKIEISYYSSDELERIIELIGEKYQEGTL